MLTAAILVIFPLCMAVGAVSDLVTMTIPNRVSVILIAGFLLIAPIAGLPLTDIGFHVLAGLVVFAGVFALFALNVMGGGDAKILAASAIWFGWDQSLFAYLMYVAFMGGLLTFLIIMLRGQKNTLAFTGLQSYLPRPLLESKKIPYGIAIGIGAFMAYPESPLMRLLLPA